MVSVGNKILFAGGSRVDIYDISNGTWSTAELSIPRNHLTTIAAGNKVFFAGGTTGDPYNDFGTQSYSTVDIYDASNNSWSTTHLTQARSGMAAASVGNKVFFAGGFGPFTIGNTTFFGYNFYTVDIYDLTTNTWSAATLSEAKVGMSAVTFNNKIYFAGGEVNGAYSNKIDIYDNASNSWSTSTLSEPKTGIAGIAVADKIYWAGGLKASHEICKVETLDLNTQTTSLDYLSRPAIVEAVLKDNQIVYYKWHDRLFDIYNLKSKTWSIGLLPANSPTSDIISVNNTIYLIGSTQLYKLEF